MESPLPSWDPIGVGGFLASIVLKDEFFERPNHQSSREYLRFAQGDQLSSGNRSPGILRGVSLIAWALSQGIHLLKDLDV